MTMSLPQNRCLLIVTGTKGLLYMQGISKQGAYVADECQINQSIVNFDQLCVLWRARAVRLLPYLLYVGWFLLDTWFVQQLSSLCLLWRFGWQRGTLLAGRFIIL